jgi:prolipoprotein diacylglyceryltransferase
VAGPVGYVLGVRWWPTTEKLLITDALVPALVLGWALGRFIGPQFMYAGGGHLTNQWFGMHYAGQDGKRVPVPLIQGLEDAALWLGLLWLDRRTVHRCAGIVTGVGLIIWGVVRSVDERLLLGQQGHAGSVLVQFSGLVLASIGAVILARVTRRAKTPVSN